MGLALDAVMAVKVGATGAFPTSSFRPSNAEEMALAVEEFRELELQGLIEITDLREEDQSGQHGLGKLMFRRLR